MCERVIEYGRQGMGKAEIAYELDVSRETIRLWEREFEDFLGAMTRARELSQGWWEKQGRLGIRDRNFNANAYSLQVRNRFPADWRDKQTHEHTGEDGGPVEIVRRIVPLSVHGESGNGNGPKP